MPVIVLSVLAALFVPTAEVSNPVVVSEPGIGARVADAPSSVTVALRRAVEGPVVLTVKDPSGKVVSAPQSSMLATNVATDLDYGLQRGTYTVTYRVQTDRGPEGGSFQFVYGSGGSPASLTTWAGYSDVPKDVALPDDEAAVAAEEAGEPIPTPSSTTTAPPTEVEPEPGDDVATASDQLDSEDSAAPTWLFVLLGVALLGAAGAVAVVLRRRSAAS